MVFSLQKKNYECVYIVVVVVVVVVVAVVGGVRTWLSFRETWPDVMNVHNQ